METREILEQVRSGSLSVEQAEAMFRKQPYEEMGYAKLDGHREVRTGFAEGCFARAKRMNIFWKSTGNSMIWTDGCSEQEPVSIRLN